MHFNDKTTPIVVCIILCIRCVIENTQKHEKLDFDEKRQKMAKNGQKSDSGAKVQVGTCRFRKKGQKRGFLAIFPHMSAVAFFRSAQKVPFFGPPPGPQKWPFSELLDSEKMQKIRSF